MGGSKNGQFTQRPLKATSVHGLHIVFSEDAPSPFSGHWHFGFESLARERRRHLLEGRRSHDSAEMVPQHGCGSESHSGGDQLDRQAGCFQQFLFAADTPPIHRIGVVPTCSRNRLFKVRVLNGRMPRGRRRAGRRIGHFQRTPLRMKNGRKSSMTFTEGSAFLRTIAPYQQVTSNDASFGGSCVVDVPPSIPASEITSLT